MTVRNKHELKIGARELFLLNNNSLSPYTYSQDITNVLPIVFLKDYYLEWVEFSCKPPARPEGYDEEQYIEYCARNKYYLAVRVNGRLHEFTYDDRTLPFNESPRVYIRDTIPKGGSITVIFSYQSHSASWNIMYTQMSTPVSDTDAYPYPFTDGYEGFILNPNWENSVALTGSSGYVVEQINKWTTDSGYHSNGYMNIIDNNPVLNDWNFFERDNMHRFPVSCWKQEQGINDLYHFIWWYENKPPKNVNIYVKELDENDNPILTNVTAFEKVATDNEQGYTLRFLQANVLEPY